MIIRTAVATVSLALALTLAPPAKAQDLELTPAIVEQINLVAKLTDYGVAREDPLLLLAAARMLADLEDAIPASAEPIGREVLVAKARQLAGDQPLDDLISAISEEASRGLCHGPGTYYGCF